MRINKILAEALNIYNMVAEYFIKADIKAIILI